MQIGEDMWEYDSVDILRRQYKEQGITYSQWQTKVEEKYDNHNGCNFHIHDEREHRKHGAQNHSKNP